MARLRLAARLLVFDQEDRILLFQLHNPVSGNTWWATPGGGVEPGEDLRAAAVRELLEETGQAPQSLDGPVFSSEHLFRSGQELILQREQFFAARVADPTVDRSGLDELEGTLIVASRWWTVAEVETSVDRVYPEALGVVARAVLRGREVPDGARVRVIEARGPRHVGAARRLFREYWAEFGFDPTFQDFDTETAALPGPYAPPQGALLLALDGREPIGVAGLRPYSAGVAELKRTYVRPKHRGQGLGRRLAARIVGVARAAGYATLRLDTQASMREAIALYRDMGFVDIPPYRESPLPDPVYLELDLAHRA